MKLSEAGSDVLEAVAASRGHFLYESGHHGDLWLDLDLLFVNARRARCWALALAERVADTRPDFVCGPLSGGAFIAQPLAAELGVGFIFAERLILETGQIQYQIPKSLRDTVCGKRVLLVDDVVNAGSALRLTLADLLNCGSELVGFATYLTLGDASQELAEEYHVPFYSLASLERNIWTPDACQLCESGVPLLTPLA